MRIGTGRMPRLRPSKEWHIRENLRRSAAARRAGFSAREPASEESGDSLKMRASSLCVGCTSTGQVNTTVRPLRSSLAVILGGREYRISKIVYRIACIRATASVGGSSMHVPARTSAKGLKTLSVTQVRPVGWYRQSDIAPAHRTAVLTPLVPSRAHPYSGHQDARRRRFGNQPSVLSHFLEISTLAPSLRYADSDAASVRPRDRSDQCSRARSGCHGFE